MAKTKAELEKEITGLEVQLHNLERKLRERESDTESLKTELRNTTHKFKVLLEKFNELEGVIKSRLAVLSPVVQPTDSYSYPPPDTNKLFSDKPKKGKKAEHNFLRYVLKFIINNRSKIL